MTYDEAYQVLKDHNQLHLLTYYEELSDEEKSTLLQQISLIDFGVLDVCTKEKEQKERGTIEPLAAMQLLEIEERTEEFTTLGLKIIRQGKVGALLLAGGMGTRLGSDNPKGMYNIGTTKEVYIFECLIRNLLDVVEQSGTWIHLFVMTSDKNHEATVEFFEEMSYFGYNKEYITFFTQEMSPATDYNFSIYMEEKGKISTSPNGNGGWYSSMAKWGVLDKVKAAGIEWINVFAVDNVLQRMADPCFIGATLASDCAIGAKVVKKAAPDEKVGVMCLEDGKPSIVEYYDLTEEMMNAKDASGQPAYNFGVILNYLFRVKDLNDIAKQNLPLHLVEKKISYLDENAVLIKPEAPNGYKFETLVLDMIHLSKNCLPFEVVRNKEFAPIKNMTGVDSVESAKILLEENGVIL